MWRTGSDIGVYARVDTSFNGSLLYYDDVKIRFLLIFVLRCVVIAIVQKEGEVDFSSLLVLSFLHIFPDKCF